MAAVLATSDIPDALINKAESYVKDELASNDASHDYSHIDRVRKLARRIAAEEGMNEAEVRLADLCALLHDVKDWKYADGGKSGSETVREYLKAADGGSESLANDVATVVEFVGFKGELDRRAVGSAPAAGGDKVDPAEGDEKGAAPAPAGSTATASLEALADLPAHLTKVWAAVQDADRLDAIGAIGIARCFTFGGAKGRVLYDPAAEPKVGMSSAEYKAQGKRGDGTTLNHFYEKLLLLKGLMKTGPGRKIAEGRHGVMQAFVDRFKLEWEGEA